MENVDFKHIQEELRYIHMKVDRLEKILIPEVDATEKDRQELEEALSEHERGLTIDFKKIRKE